MRKWPSRISTSTFCFQQKTTTRKHNQGVSFRSLIVFRQCALCQPTSSYPTPLSSNAKCNTWGQKNKGDQKTVFCATCSTDKTSVGSAVISCNQYFSQKCKDFSPHTTIFHLNTKMKVGSPFPVWGTNDRHLSLAAEMTLVHFNTGICKFSFYVCFLTPKSPPSSHVASITALTITYGRYMNQTS